MITLDVLFCSIETLPANDMKNVLHHLDYKTECDEPSIFN